MNILNAAKIRSEYHDRKRIDAQGGKGKGKAKGANGVDKAGDAKGKKKAMSGNADGDDAASNAQKLRIRPGERMGDFNARVEQAFAPIIGAAARHASRHSQNAKKRKRKDGTGDEDEDDLGDPEAREKRKANAMKAEAREKREKDELREQRHDMESKMGGEERDFATVTQRKGLREVADAPPVLTAGKFSKASAGSKADRPGQRLIFGKAASGKDADATNAAMANKRILEQERERVIGVYRQKKEAEQKAKLGLA